MVSNGDEIGASKLTGEMLSMITKIQSTVAGIVNDTTGSSSVGTLHTSRRASPFPWLTCHLLIRFLEANHQVKSLIPSNYPHPQLRTIFACACRHVFVSFSSLPFLQFPYVTFFIFLGPFYRNLSLFAAISRTHAPVPPSLLIVTRFFALFSLSDTTTPSRASVPPPQDHTNLRSCHNHLQKGNQILEQACCHSLFAHFVRIQIGLLLLCVQHFSPFTRFYIVPI